MAPSNARAPLFARIVVAALILTAVGTFMWLSNHYQEICPTVMNQQDGNIYSLNEHGRIVYLTLEEHLKLQAAETYFTGAVLCFFALMAWEFWKRHAENESGPDKRP
jgi:hypothetical protein